MNPPTVPISEVVARMNGIVAPLIRIVAPVNPATVPFSGATVRMSGTVAPFIRTVAPFIGTERKLFRAAAPLY